MTNIAPLRPPRARHRLHYGFAGLVIHGAVSLTVATYAFVLALSHDLGPGIVEGLFGTLIGGHVVGAAAAQLHGRASDNAPGE